MLQPIDADSLDEALALLAKGFPVHDARFWRAGLERLQGHHDRYGFGPVGYVMGQPGRRTGVVLTMVSERLGPDGERRRVVNLSSWYIEEQARWLAPMMLKQLTSELGTTFTDLTPSPPVRKLISALGFQPWNTGVIVALLPLVAVLGWRAASVISCAALASASLSPALRRIVDDHEAMGCVTLGLRRNEAVSPLVFLPTRRRGLPSARLLYAENKREVIAQFGEVARHLLRRGILFAEIPADSTDQLPGGWFTTGAPPTFYKGSMAPEGIDHAWSEFAFLRL
jgi:hypothetical protein